MASEPEARMVIDEKLRHSGWVVQDRSRLDLTSSLGIAVREYPTNTGPADYVLFVEGRPVGVVEAKATNKGENLTTVEEQTRRYADSQLKWIVNSNPIRFAYEATDVITRFTDYDDERARSREVFTFHRPETLKDYLAAEDTLRNRLKHIPKLDETGLWKCQVDAINNLERSFSEGRPKALIQMATGSGKTFTAITASYRMLRHSKAKRILFLVDTKNLGEQAEEEFRGYRPSDNSRLLPELYNICRLSQSSIPDDAKICISTIQRMYSILQGKELDEDSENIPLDHYVDKTPKEVVYNQRYPIEFFDLIIVDECHRSIYNVWKQVLDYFDAFIVGLTATPDKRTFGFFNENVVSEYSHEQAVIDGVNVASEIYVIETDITNRGSVILKQLIEKRNRLSRMKRWEQMDEDVPYATAQLDRDIVNPSQIRTVIRAFRDRIMTEIFPDRREIPKTLIFAKTDSHAEDIVQIVREEFAQGNEFCKKITYQTEKPKAALSSFRNEYYPRIAVTVDMIATGTDVKSIECLLFMRDVHSRNYFEQMKGRGTRVLSEEDLKKVTPSAVSKKDHYVIVDAVGVTKSVKTDSRALERNPSKSLKDLMITIALGSRDEDIMTSLANRLIRLNCQMDDSERDRLKNISDGRQLTQIISNLLDSFDPEKVEIGSKEQKEFIELACNPFNSPDLREYIENVRRSHDQIIDSVNLDRLLFAGPSDDQIRRASQNLANFRKFIDDKKDEIAALSIIYNQSYRNRVLTFEMIKELHEAIVSSSYGLTKEGLWRSYSLMKADKVRDKGPVRMLTDIIALVRFELGQIKELYPFQEAVKYNFMKWTMTKNAGNVQFTDEQMEWLRMIRDHISTSVSITPEDLELSPFSDHGGLGRFYEVFGPDYEQVLVEMNQSLIV